jgi:hypothetical protein
MADELEHAETSEAPGREAVEAAVEADQKLQDAAADPDVEGTDSPSLTRNKVPGSGTGGTGPAKNQFFPGEVKDGGTGSARGAARPEGGTEISNAEGPHADPSVAAERPGQGKNRNDERKAK